MLCIVLALVSVFTSQQTAGGPATARPSLPDAPVASPATKPVESGERWPVLVLKDREFLVNPRDGAATEIPSGPAGVWSADGRIGAWVVPRSREEDEQWNSNLVRFRRSVKSDHAAPPGEFIAAGLNTRLIGWCADGKTLIYAAGRRGHAKLYSVAPESSGNDPPVHTTVLQLHNDLGSAVIGPDDTVYIFSITEERGKERIGDVMAVRDGKTEFVMENVDVRSLAISPDGRRIAVGQIGLITILSTQAPHTVVREIKFPDIDDKLYAHLAGAMAWRPDGQELAAKITFAGGRFIADPTKKPEPMAGDRELYLIPVQGKTRALTYSPVADGHVGRLRWGERVVTPASPADNPARDNKK